MRVENRKSRRFPPDAGTLAWIDPNMPEVKGDFRPEIPALVTDEALQGCGIVTLTHDRLTEEAECMVRVGDLPPLKSQIRWIKDLHNDVRRVGVMFLE